MTFRNQQDRAVFEADTTDDVPVTVLQMALEETSLVQFNFFVKAQDDAGRSMNLVFQGAAKRLLGSPNAVLVGAVQQISNRRDAGVLWTAQVNVNAEFLEIVLTGEAATNVEWSLSFYMDWVFSNN
jgi:hypothetical protein